MSQVTITLDTYENSEELKLALEGHKILEEIRDLDSDLRSAIKHDGPIPIPSTLSPEAREELEKMFLFGSNKQAIAELVRHYLLQILNPVGLYP